MGQFNIHGFDIDTRFLSHILYGLSVAVRFKHCWVIEWNYLEGDVRILAWLFILLCFILSGNLAGRHETYYGGAFKEWVGLMCIV